MGPAMWTTIADGMLDSSPQALRAAGINPDPSRWTDAEMLTAMRVLDELADEVAADLMEG